MTEPNTTNNGSAPPEVARSTTRQAAIDRMIARKLQATSTEGQEEHARLVAWFRTRERAQRILEAIDAR